jgi:hypothetical protein
VTAASFVFQSDHAQAARANDEVAALAERLGDSAIAYRRPLALPLLAEQQRPDHSRRLFVLSVAIICGLVRGLVIPAAAATVPAAGAFRS